MLSGGDQRKARKEAKTQLLETLKDSRPAIRADGSLFSRMWLNRIVEAAVSVVRENNVRLSEAELDALNRFRSGGTPSKDWGGIGVIFGDEELPTETPHVKIGGDRIPLFLYGVKLDRDLLRAAAETDPAELITAGDSRRELRSSTKDRVRRPADDAQLDGGASNGDVVVVAEPEPDRPGEANQSPAEGPELAHRTAVLGVNASTGESVEWKVSGEGALNNGHVEIYGQSGFGKTQFVKSLLAQLHGAGAHFTVCDFKDDYGTDQTGTFFPSLIGAKYFDWPRTPFRSTRWPGTTRRNARCSRSASSCAT